ncbi:MAG: triose-phosphate isomerase [Solirubrobacterales bacterium]
MTPRTPLCAANWKMHKTRREAVAFADALPPLVGGEVERVEVFICPPFTAIVPVVERLGDTAIRVAAQNMHFEDSGAFTGEVSPPMLAELGVDGAIVGHSERRQHFGETDDALARKVPAALAAGLTPILCVGETLEQREGGETEAVLRRQIEADLSDVAEDDLERVVVAYEPIWAIGTGQNATPDQAVEAIGFIRSLVGSLSESAAEAIRILYGGSVKPENAGEVLAPDGIDGALVGGASLDPDDFAAVVAACR